MLQITNEQKNVKKNFIKLFKAFEQNEVLNSDIQTCAFLLPTKSPVLHFWSVNRCISGISYIQKLICIANIGDIF